MIFMVPLLGTSLGAASGALGGALSDAGIDDDFVKDTTVWAIRSELHGKLVL